MSVGDFLAKRGYTGPKCEKCRDKGVPIGGELRYRWNGIPVPSAICDCPAGERLRKDIVEQTERAKVEEEERRKNRIERYIDECGVPLRMINWTLETYPGDPQLVQLARDFIASKPPFGDSPDAEKCGLLLIGNSGSGKTGLAVAIVNASIADDRQSLFVETGSLLRDIRATFGPKAEKSAAEVTAPVRESTFLVLDDIGDVGRDGSAMSDFARAEIFDLVNHRHGMMKWTVFTSNLTAKQLAKQLGERTWWRLAEMCMVVDVGGKNLRA